MATDVTPTMIRSSGEKHVNTKDSIKRTEDQVTASVDFLTTTNAGALMKRLKEIQTDWTQEMEQVQGKLVGLAEYMESCAGQLEKRNEDHSGDLR